MTDPYTALDLEETRLLTELAQVRAAKATIRRVCGVIDPPHGPTLTIPEDSPPGKSEPGSPPGTPRPRELDICQLIAARGPMRTGEVAEALGVAAPVASRWLTESRLVSKPPGAKQASPWELTPAGKTAVDGETFPI